MILFFVALVLCQSLVTLTILTVIISRTNLDSMKSRMSDTVLSLEGYLGETFNDMRVKGDLIAGQQKTVDYADFRLKNLLARELVLYRESLGIESLAVFLDPSAPFAAAGDASPVDESFRARLQSAMGGERALFLSHGGSGTSLFVLSPIRRAARIIGVLSLSLAMDQAFVARVEKIVNARVILRFEDISVADTSLADAQVRRVADAYAQSSGGGERTISAGPLLASALDLGTLGLAGGAAFCLTDTTDSVRQINRYNAISLLATLAILTLALVSGIVFYQRTFLRRFQTILQGITHIARGDFNPPFRLGWQDEFGQLAAAFDDMCAKLLVRDQELAQLSEKLALSARLAALGEMAAGVAHQVRNPLVVMKVSAEMLRDNFTVRGDEERYRKLTHLIVDETDSLALVISNFLDFARPRKLQPAPCSVRSMAELAIGSLPVERFPGIEIRTLIPEELAEHPMDRSLMSQALANLVLNALQASPSGGAVEVRARHERERLFIEVQDWGAGMDEQTMKRIFNPFFTTRESGTGLGLSIAHRIIEGHGGTIDVRSVPGAGATFTVRI